MDKHNGLIARLLGRGEHTLSQEDAPTDYRRHLPDTDNAPIAPPPGRRDWGNAVMPLFGACPRLPKTAPRGK